MHQTVSRAQDQRLPPALNVITLVTFAASLSGHALDPVLPHVTDDFAITIATAASLAAVFAFTFAAVQPVVVRRRPVRQGTADDLLPGDPRLSNVVGAFSTSFPLSFASRILAGIGAGGVFPVSLGPTKTAGRRSAGRSPDP